MVVSLAFGLMVISNEPLELDKIFYAFISPCRAHVPPYYSP
jgi:hypothetical protein